MSHKKSKLTPKALQDPSKLPPGLQVGNFACSARKIGDLCTVLGLFSRGRLFGNFCSEHKCLLSESKRVVLERLGLFPHLGPSGHNVFFANTGSRPVTQADVTESVVEDAKTIANSLADFVVVFYLVFEFGQNGRPGRWEAPPEH